MLTRRYCSVHNGSSLRRLTLMATTTNFTASHFPLFHHAMEPPLGNFPWILGAKSHSFSFFSRFTSQNTSQIIINLMVMLSPAAHHLLFNPQPISATGFLFLLSNLASPVHWRTQPWFELDFVLSLEIVLSLWICLPCDMLLAPPFTVCVRLCLHGIQMTRKMPAVNCFGLDCALMHVLAREHHHPIAVPNHGFHTPRILLSLDSE